MTTAADILGFLETLAPAGRKMEWDNCGLLCGRRDKQIRRVLIALDPFEDTAREAVRLNADLILTHHPLIFHPLHAVMEDSAVGRVLMTLIQNDICAVNAHTNLDIAPWGVNDVLARKLHLTDIEVIDPIDTDADGNVWGLLRAGNVAEQSLDTFLAAVKKELGAPLLRYCSAGTTVRRVAVGGGACADEYRAALRAGCDTFVTSDAKYNDFWDAQDAGLNLIDAGHFYTENPVCEFLRDQITQRFPEVEAVISREHSDCIRFYSQVDS